VLGALGSGYQEQSLVTFEVLASDGTPYAGLPVKFSHVSQGDSFIGTVASCAGTNPIVCSAQGITNPEGKVSVVLHSGRWFAVLAVKAEATAQGVTRAFVAGGFTVLGAKPNGARFSIDCEVDNVPALTEHDCLYSRYSGPKNPVNCTATVGDRHDNPVAVPTLVSFQSEAGLIVPATFTPAYVPSSDNTGLGQAVGLLGVYGAGLPFDVPPLANEPSAVVDYGCGVRTTNPRDGLVTVMALVQGEEGFVDSDLDGRYTAGEHFIDLGEPFLDVDDDGVRDPTEWYEDVNLDGAYTGPNGKWDSDTVLWTQAHVLYTGHPFFARAANGYEQFTRVYGASGNPPAPSVPVPPFTVYMGPPPTSEWYGVFFADQHFNPVTSGSKFAATPLAGNVDAKMTEPDNTADSLGMSFRMLYCDRPGVAGAICRDGPADQACTTTPCYLQTRVGEAFHPGNDATLVVTCKKEGPDVVTITATVEGVTSGFSFSGDCLP
jgi:hypothetical protein